MAETLREALEVVTEMENEGVVTWGDEGHRQRFLAALAKPSVDLDVETLERASYQCWLRRPRHRATGEELAAEYTRLRDARSTPE